MASAWLHESESFAAYCRIAEQHTQARAADQQDHIDFPNRLGTQPDRSDRCRDMLTSHNSR